MIFRFFIVSYHGTEKDRVGSIAENGYLLSKGKRFVYGFGIYSTPEIRVAESYAKGFTHAGDRYKVLVQNRINPEAVKIIPDTKTGFGEYWVTEKEEDIHPYGLLLKKV